MQRQNANANAQMLKKVEELRIPSIVLSTKDAMFLLTGKAQHKLVFRRRQRTLWIQNNIGYFLLHDVLKCQKA